MFNQKFTLNHQQESMQGPELPVVPIIPTQGWINSKQKFYFYAYLILQGKEKNPFNLNKRWMQFNDEYIP